MATAAAPAILETEDRDDGLRIHSYRWQHGDVAGEDHAFTRTVPLDRATIEDRWAGLVGDDYEQSKLQRKLDAVLLALGHGLTRRTEHFSDGVVDGKIVDVDAGVLEIDELVKVIREWLISRASKPGVSL